MIITFFIKFRSRLRDSAVRPGGGESGKSWIKSSPYLHRIVAWRRGNTEVEGLHSRHILRDNSETELE